MGVEDMAKQAGDYISQNSDKINEALKSEQAEAVSDKVLDGVAGLADKVTGGKFTVQIGDLRDQADKHIGNE